ncbi:MAG: PHP domain-containing protein [Clostridia bacterium]
MFDCHVHGPFSSDSKETMAKIQARLSKDTTLSMILTEHWDFDMPTKESFVFDLQEYAKAATDWRSNRLLFGIEFGIWQGTIAKTRTIANAFPYDIVLGSVHTAEYINFISGSLPEGMNKKTYFDFYFHCMLELIEQAEYFDVLAHLDYISRYIALPDPYIRLGEHGELVEEVFKQLLARDKILELNTKLFFKPDAVAAAEKLYQLYYDLGGRYVTLGSDAHHASGIAHYFQQATMILEKCQLRPVYFLDRKLVYIN